MDPSQDNNRRKIHPLQTAGVVMILMPIFWYLIKDPPSTSQALFRIGLVLVGGVLFGIGTIRLRQK